MTRKIAWLLVTCLMALSLVLTSCGKVAPATTPTTTPTTTVTSTTTPTTTVTPTTTPTTPKVAEQPQYGGTVAISEFYKQASWDPRVNMPWQMFQLELCYNQLIMPDYGRGPSGTGQIAFSASGNNKGEYTGMLAESWEQTDLYTVTFHIRKGVRFQDIPPVSGREVTAQDVDFCLNQYQTFPQSTWYKAPGTPKEKLWWTTEVVDKYTITVHYNLPRYNLAEGLLWVTIFPREMLEKYGDLTDWKACVGTGPFIVKDWVADSSMTVVKNPNYWETDPLHPQNRLPYLDVVNLLIIEDVATRLAAFRTGKLPYLRVIPWRDGQDLVKKYPDVKFRKVMEGIANVVRLRNDWPAFKDVRVRRALNMAIDYQGIVDKFYEGNAVLFAHPVRPDAPTYVPLEKMPQEVQERYTYNPQKAKQLLAEAGYPNGLTVKFMCIARDMNQVSLIINYWDAIGVKSDVQVVEQVTQQSTMLAFAQPEVCFNTSGTGPSEWGNLGQWYGPSTSNYSRYNNPKFVELYDKAQATLDNAQRIDLIKEAVLIALTDCTDMCLPTAMVYNAWWPWMKNYSGEAGVAYPGGLMRYVWIDQALKKKMGY